jgi:hypothetical protein
MHYLIGNYDTILHLNKNRWISDPQQVVPGNSASEKPKKSSIRKMNVLAPKRYSGFYF